MTVDSKNFKLIMNDIIDLVNTKQIRACEAYMYIAYILADKDRNELSLGSGAVIVDKINHIIGVGCNNSDIKFSDDKKPVQLTAITNAIKMVENKDLLNGATIYTTSIPNSETLKMINKTGICRLCYYENGFNGNEKQLKLLMPNNTTSHKFLEKDKNSMFNFFGK